MTTPLREKARKIALVMTDVDGVLTDTGVYYSAEGELLKRFSIRDGMGVERLRECAQIETGMITGENSGACVRRAEKLGITILVLQAKNKLVALKEIAEKRNLKAEQIAYIGDDVNDLRALQFAGLSACPADAVEEIRQIVDYVCTRKGGHGAFREFAEFIIKFRNSEVKA